eukprot:NODE_6782_length_435_cov_29.233161_g5189_i0.p1 GENE.NODE_6782_length_435_cov_29.233161_g5189_i0~~NODE_6782_length_435_cov_29.233161_g5189_i0.p1  ORF type:complete len:113 (-),score=21.11 NODE_6782_length_435_cov_29.233161_g5189_i0:97-402(-)
MGAGGRRHQRQPDVYGVRAAVSRFFFWLRRGPPTSVLTGNHRSAPFPVVHFFLLLVCVRIRFLCVLLFMCSTMAAIQKKSAKNFFISAVVGNKRYSVSSGL